LNTSFHYTAGAGYYEQYKDNDSFEDYGLQPIVTNMPFMLINGDTLFTPGGKIEYTDLIRRKHLANHFTGATWSLNHSLHRLQSTIGGSFSTYHGNHFGKIIWAEFASNSSIDYEWYRSKAVKNDMNVYLKNEFAFNSQLSLWLDLQFRHINYSMDGMDDDMRNITQKHNFNFFNPKTGFTYKISNLQSLYASVAIANREPNRDNFVDANPSQPAPERELLIDFESGYSLNTDAYNVSATAFYMLYKDQLVLTGAINDVGAPVMINVPDSYRTGVEISASFRPLSFVTIEPALSLSRNKIKTFTEYIDNWDSTAQTEILHKNTDLAFAPSMVAGNKLSIKAGKHLDASLISKYVSEQFIDNTGDASHKLDSYFVNNILIRYSIQPKWCNQLDFSVMLNNIFNAEYESNAWVYSYIYEGRKQQYEGYFPQAGFNFMAGINVKL
jgi:iron complex outermembrane receptor protein